MADRRVDAGGAHGVDDRAGLVGARGQGLLDEQVHAGGGEPLHDGQVLVGGDGDDSEIGDAGRQQLVDRAVHERAVVDGAEAIAAGVHGAGEADAGHALQQPRVMAADHPEPEERGGQHRGKATD